MNWPNWIIALLGAVDLAALSGLIVAVAKLRSTVREGEAQADKAAADADKAAAQADKETVLAMREAYNALKDALAEVRVSNDRADETHLKDQQTIAEKDAVIAEKDARIVALLEENATFREENASLKMMICKHAACPFKEPPIGKGGEWYDTHKHDDMLTDTESIIVIGKRHGWSLKRLPPKPVKEPNE